jgi:hypothetical protein
MGHWGGGHQAAACQTRRRQSLGQKRHARPRTRSRGRIPQAANRKPLPESGRHGLPKAWCQPPQDCGLAQVGPPPGMDQTPVAGTKRAPRRPAASKGAATGTIRSRNNTSTMWPGQAAAP